MKIAIKTIAASSSKRKSWTRRSMASIRSVTARRRRRTADAHVRSENLIVRRARLATPALNEVALGEERLDVAMLMTKSMMMPPSVPDAWRMNFTELKDFQAMSTVV